jgi:hypothetical protein
MLAQLSTDESRPDSGEQWFVCPFHWATPEVLSEPLDNCFRDSVVIPGSGLTRSYFSEPTREFGLTCM